ARARCAGLVTVHPPKRFPLGDGTYLAFVTALRGSLVDRPEGRKLAESRSGSGITAHRICIMQRCDCGRHGGRSTCPFRRFGRLEKTGATAPAPPVSGGAPDGLPWERRRWAVAAIFTALAMASLDTVIANVALPAIATDLHVSPAEVVWVVNVYQIVLV